MPNEALQTFVQQLQDSDAYRRDTRVRTIINEGIQRISALSEDSNGAELRREIRGLQSRIAPLLRQSNSRPERRGGVSIEEAKAILGDDHFFGLESLDGIALAPADIPPIPFSAADLERAKELGSSLRLRSDKAPDNANLTMQKMHEMLQPEFDQAGNGQILYDTDWYENEAFFTNAVPEVSWALTSNEVIPDSEDKDYLEQTELIAQYLQGTVYAGSQLPQEYAEAIEELNTQKDEIRSLIEADEWQQAAERLEALKLNKLTRRTPTEVLYDMLVTFKKNGQRHLEDCYDWTGTRDSDGYLVIVGGFGSEGVHVAYDDPDYSSDYLGVVLSRKF
ncbi:hypothetical protein H6770_05650 [Candidatus Peribacteria bacterium]|nr:hypothetical protein [Candidatus Peribacteria bacterium]